MDTGKEAVIARLTGNSPPPVLAELAGSPEAPSPALPDISSELLHIASHLPQMRAWGERIDDFLN
jgi:hypothetical protein